VKVDLGRTFEKGQGKVIAQTTSYIFIYFVAAYVAISRATTVEQLQVINFDAAK
jgi:hypothetical protein